MREPLEITSVADDTGSRWNGDDSGVLAAMEIGGFEQVVHCHDRGTGLRAVIAIHDTSLGPALGGVRMHPYETEGAAVRDCMRLARAMTLKAAAAGVNLGGGKSVILGDPRREKTEALLRAHGRFVRTLGGRYIPGIDVGTDMADLEIIGVEAEPVSCVDGDPSPMTALGVLEGIRACVREVFDTDTLEGLRVCIQGAGHVGSNLAAQLAAENVIVSLTDLDADRARQQAEAIGGTAIPPDQFLSAEVDVLAPCAMGGVVNDESIGQLRCTIVAGAANDVLESARHGNALHERGVLYAPDFCLNSGGLVFLEEEMLGHSRERAERRVRRVGDLVAAVISRARSDQIPTSQAAQNMAIERLRNLANVGPPVVA